jgi:hypothetical protein
VRPVSLCSFRRDEYERTNVHFLGQRACGLLRGRTCEPHRLNQFIIIVTKFSFFCTLQNVFFVCVGEQSEINPVLFPFLETDHHTATRSRPESKVGRRRIGGFGLPAGRLCSHLSHALTRPRGYQVGAAREMRCALASSLARCCIFFPVPRNARLVRKQKRHATGITAPLLAYR